MSWSKIGKGSKKDKKELGIKEVEGSYNSLPGHDNPNDSSGETNRRTCLRRL